MAAWFPAEMRMIELEIFWEETAETMPREAFRSKAIARTWSHTVGVLAALLLDVQGGVNPATAHAAQIVSRSTQHLACPIRRV